MTTTTRVATLIAVLLVAPASATLVEFTEAQHTGQNVFTAELAAAAFYSEGGRWQDNALHLETDELIVRTSYVEYLIDTGAAGRISGPPDHDQTTLHNVRLEAWPNHAISYLNCHAIESAVLTYQSASATSVPSKQESQDDITPILMPAPRTTDVSQSLQVGSSDHMESFIEGGVSLNLWGWTVRITSDEGTFEYETGPSRDVEAGPASIGSAKQIQVESENATVTIAGDFNDVHRVWMHNAIAESDRMDLRLAGEDLPTDQEVFAERSRLTVLEVADTVTADITKTLPEPAPGALPESESEASNATTATPTNPDGGGELLGTNVPDPSVTGGVILQWVLFGVVSAGVVVFFVVRQWFGGWPAGALVAVAMGLHARAKDALAVTTASVGHLLQPSEPRHRFYRGLAHYDQDHWRRALRDLDWCQRRMAEFPKHRAVAAYTAARAAAQMERAGTAAGLLLLAHHINGKALWEADQDAAFAPVRGVPQFEGRLAGGLD